MCPYFPSFYLGALTAAIKMGDALKDDVTQYRDLLTKGIQFFETELYDGTIRNPFNEYECGHWYARALSSYGLIQGLTGVRYDAVEKTLYIDSNVGNNFRSFLATASGFGTAGLKNGKPFIEMKMGNLDVKHVIVSGKEMSL